MTSHVAQKRSSDRVVRRRGRRFMSREYSVVRKREGDAIEGC
jgi:hypothetical protein